MKNKMVVGLVIVSAMALSVSAFSADFYAKYDENQAKQALLDKQRQIEGPGIYETTVHYWSPKLRGLLSDAYAYWKPGVAHVYDDTMRYWVPRIDDTVLEFIRKQYAVLDNYYGDKVAEQYLKTMEFWTPIIQMEKEHIKEYWVSKNPLFFKYLGDVPASVKKVFDKVIVKALLSMPKNADAMKDVNLPDSVRNAMQGFSKSMVVSKDRAFRARLDRLVNRLRYSASDYLMQDCYQAVALESDVVNAFNTGCTIFVTKALAAKMSDDELTAVLAHEMSHGDQGHLVKNLGLVAASYGKHFSSLISQEMAFLATGKIGPLMASVIEIGNNRIVMKAYGALAPAVEIAADQGGALMLERAGISRQYLKDALMKVHGLKVTDKVPEDQADKESIRNYPSLYKRLKAVDRAEAKPLMP